MKKPYSPNLSVLRRRSSLLSRRSLQVVSVFVALAVILAGMRLLLPDVLAGIARPFWSFGTGVTSALSTTAASFTANQALLRDRDRLIAENMAVTENNRVLGAKVADLEKLLGNGQPQGGILAGILVRPPVTPYDTLIVDAGSKQGVAPSALVYGPGGVPVGTVESVAGDSSHVALFSAPGRVSDGWIGDNRVALTVTGAGAGAFTATLSHTAGIAAGATVYLPGPGAIPVGTVVRVESDPSSPRDTIRIQSYLSPFTLTWVTIATRP